MNYYESLATLAFLSAGRWSWRRLSWQHLGAPGNPLLFGQLRHLQFALLNVVLAASSIAGARRLASDALFKLSGSLLLLLRNAHRMRFHTSHVPHLFCSLHAHADSDFFFWGGGLDIRTRPVGERFCRTCILTGSVFLNTLCSVKLTAHLRRLHGARESTCPPLLQMAGREGGTVSQWTAQQETDQTVLTITKALTKTTNCTRRAKKVEGYDKKVFFSGVRRRTCPH